MRYSLSGVLKIFSFSILMLIGLFCLLITALETVRHGFSGDLDFFLGLGTVFFVVGFLSLRNFLKFTKMTYDWYRSEYPSNVNGNKVSCYSCGNNRIHVRALMNRTYYREHFCTQCGKTLYYSPEQN